MDGPTAGLSISLVTSLPHHQLYQRSLAMGPVPTPMTNLIMFSLSQYSVNKYQRFVSVSDRTVLVPWGQHNFMRCVLSCKNMHYASSFS